jgi:hypothetical protein
MLGASVPFKLSEFIVDLNGGPGKVRAQVRGVGGPISLCEAGTLVDLGVRHLVESARGSGSGDETRTVATVKYIVKRVGLQ